MTQSFLSSPGTAGAVLVVQMEMEKMAHVTWPRRVDSDLAHSIVVC